MVVKSSMTLTSLMAKYKISHDGKEYAYINIGALTKDRIFVCIALTTSNVIKFKGWGICMFKSRKRHKLTKTI